MLVVIVKVAMIMIYIFSSYGLYIVAGVFALVIVLHGIYPLRESRPKEYTHLGENLTPHVSVNTL